MKAIKDLKHGDKIRNKQNQVLQIISNESGLLFYYNESTGFFNTLDLTKNAKHGDFINTL